MLLFPHALALDARRKIKAANEAHLGAIEALTSCLDNAETNFDLEDGGSAERSLVGSDSLSAYDPELDKADDEPSLAYPNDFDQHRSYRHLRAATLRHGDFSGEGDDLELEHDDRKPDADGEFSPSAADLP